MSQNILKLDKKNCQKKTFTKSLCAEFFQIFSCILGESFSKKLDEKNFEPYQVSMWLFFFFFLIFSNIYILEYVHIHCFGYEFCHQNKAMKSC